MNVSLFITCFNDTLFPETGRAMVRLLERLGYTVDFPEAQTCCGQMHYNTGYQREALPLIRRFVDIFGSSEVVVRWPTANCVAICTRRRTPFVSISHQRYELNRVEGVHGPRTLHVLVVNDR